MQTTIADFRRAIEEASTRLLAMSEAESASRPAPDKWSAKEIIGHLIDSAANNHRRFVLAQIEDGLNFEGYKQEDWVNIQGYREATWTDLVGLWRYYNLHLAHIMSCTPREKLHREHRLHTLDVVAWEPVDRDQPATLEYLMRDYVNHLKHHLEQIFERNKGQNRLR